jgi:hypothetical protein
VTAVWPILRATATLKQKVHAEQRIRQLLADNDLPAPDAVEYGHTCIRVFWHDPKTAVIIDIDEPPPGWKYATDPDFDPAEPDPTGEEEPPGIFGWDFDGSDQSPN